jgi:hypothetical protein
LVTYLVMSSFSVTTKINASNKISLIGVNYGCNSSELLHMSKIYTKILAIFLRLSVVGFTSNSSLTVLG